MLIPVKYRYFNKKKTCFTSILFKNGIPVYRKKPFSVYTGINGIKLSYTVGNPSWVSGCSVQLLFIIFTTTKTHKLKKVRRKIYQTAIKKYAIYFLYILARLRYGICDFFFRCKGCINKCGTFAMCL